MLSLLKMLYLDDPDNRCLQVGHRREARRGSLELGHQDAFETLKLDQVDDDGVPQRMWSSR